MSLRASYLRTLACVLLVQVLLVVGAAAQALYHNPVMRGDHPDPTVLRVGADYWALVTTGGWAPHFTILRSPDLVNWRTVGAVFQQKPDWAKGDFWAPQLVEDGGRFYLYYTARREEGKNKKGTLCVAVATAPRPDGPYTDHGPLVCQMIGSIDAFSLRDETGQRYLIWKEDGNDRDQPTPMWAQPLTADGLKLTGKPKQLFRNTAMWERHVVEGAYVLRRNGWYYMFYSGNACCGRGCNYALGVARARKILGPWEKNPANPIIGANSAWQCPGHGDVVTTPDGREYLLYHAYRKDRDTFNTGREAVLDLIEWNEKGWPVINGGRGPASEAPAPLGRIEPAPASEFFDGFSTGQLAPAWQWPMNAAQRVRLDAQGGGHLTLAPLNPAADAWTGAVLGWRVPSGNYTATALVDARALAAGTRAGLAAYSWRDAAVGIALGDGKVFIWQREGRRQDTLTTVLAPTDAAALYLRMTATDGEAYSFAYSANGRDWTPAGQRVNASYIESAHVALTAAGGAARFDWVRVDPAGAGSLPEKH
jgi:beta-xylosidase